MTSCRELRHDLGGYVLGGLDEVEAAALEAHLGGCRACRAELAELERVPELLALASGAPSAPPPRLRDRVLAAAVARRVRRRWMAAAAALALAGTLAGGVLAGLLHEPPPAMAVGLAPVEPFAAGGWATLREDGGRVTVHLEIEGMAPPPSGGAYEAWLSTREEELVSLGVLQPDGAGMVTVTLDADGPLACYRSFWVTAEPDPSPGHDGPTVVRARLPDVRD